MASSLANVVVKVEPARAYRLAPWNPAFTAALAEQLFTQNARSDENSRPARLAKQALMQDPTAVTAAAVLGFQAQLRGDGAQADRYFAYATRLSRRELRPQIWAIEQAVSQGDIEGALDRYDVALRTSASAQDVLFPVLVAALNEPRIRRSVLRRMAAQPTWAEPFVAFVAASGIAPDAAIRFFREGRAFDLPVTDVMRASIVNTLLEQNRTLEAWGYYASYRPNAQRFRSRDPNFVGAAEGATPFDWTVPDQPGLSAGLLRTAEGGLLDFSVPSSIGGTVVTQLQVLTPGRYRLEGRSSGLEQSGQSPPFWLLACQDGRELGRVPVPNSSLAGGVFAGRFTVPQGCPAQILSLMARPTTSLTDTTGQIVRLQLVPARQGE
ncbi:MAG: hypothetical protein B7Z33_12135 [Sphingomonadales bacterium 12-68-11]|nr:MAG: hypothetical protein B7Z33_12135 [Sphingomonadales bacterium 12-68-11]